MNKIPSALLAFRIMAWVTGVVLASATVWALLGYLLWGYADDGGKPGLYSLLWVAHGWLYFAYLIAAVNLAFLLLSHPENRRIASRRNNSFCFILC